ncbi:MAG: hypothetical protein WKH64_00840 [Chloroflexia bacterium]
MISVSQGVAGETCFGLGLIVLTALAASDSATPSGAGLDSSSRALTPPPPHRVLNVVDSQLIQPAQECARTTVGLVQLRGRSTTRRFTNGSSVAATRTRRVEADAVQERPVRRVAPRLDPWVRRSSASLRFCSITKADTSRCKAAPIRRLDRTHRSLHRRGGCDPDPAAVSGGVGDSDRVSKRDSPGHGAPTGLPD